MAIQLFRSLCNVHISIPSYNPADRHRANQTSTGSAAPSSTSPSEPFGGPAGFREKVFTGAVAERSSIPIKQEAIVDAVNISGVRGISGEMDSISVDGHQVQSLKIPTGTKSRESGEDIKAQGATKGGSDHAFEMDKYIKDSSAEATEAVTE